MEIASVKLEKKPVAKKKVSKKKTKKKAKKKKVNKKKAVSDEVTDPHWINPKDFDPDYFPELDEESFVYITASYKKGNNGRPPKKLRLLTLRNLAAIGCTEQEIATSCGLFKDTMTKAKKNNPIVPLLIQSGRDEGCTSLRRKQFSMALLGNERMLIWLGTNMLKQSTTPEPPEDIEVDSLSITFNVKDPVDEIQVTNAKS